MDDAQRMKWQSKLDMLKARLKEASADTQMSIQRQIEDIENKLKM